MINTIINPSQPEQSQMQWKKLLQPPSQKEWVNETFLQMGYPDLEQVNAEIFEKTIALSALVKKQASPVFLLKSQMLTSTSKTGFEANGLKISSRKWGAISSMMKEPGELCCFGLTLGNEVEATNQTMSEKSIARGFIWDALCSTLAEYYADRIETFLAFHYNQKGFRISRRFSPGYCDLPLMPSQNAIFRFCDMEAIGIQLSPSGLMTPRKSITGLVLAAKNLPLNNPCRMCKKNCAHRRTSEEAIQAIETEKEFN